MGPFKCPDCGIWWTGLEHRCRPSEIHTDTHPPFIRPTRTYCTCPPNRGDNYLGTCPIHDVLTTLGVGD